MKPDTILNILNAHETLLKQLGEDIKVLNNKIEAQQKKINELWVNR